MTTLVRTAGMVHGTPGWQLDAMYGGESARMLEEGSYDTECALRDAWSTTTKVHRYLADAAHYAEGTPSEAKILSLIDTLELIQQDIYRLADELERGRK